MLIFEMVTLQTPYGSDDQMTTLHNITAGKINWRCAGHLSNK